MWLYSLGILTTLKHRPHTKQYTGNTKHTQRYSCRPCVSYGFVWTFCLIDCLPVYYDFWFCVFMRCVCGFFSFFFLKILVYLLLSGFFLKGEKEMAWSWVGGEGGRMGRSWERWNCHRNILYEKKNLVKKCDSTSPPSRQESRSWGHKTGKADPAPRRLQH